MTAEERVGLETREAQLARLYEAQAMAGSDGYLHAHSRNRALLRRQIDIFERCKRFLLGAKSILDWGCRHAVDACLARMLLGSEVTLDGCDVDEGAYRVFFDFARLQYTRLSHPYSLPYADDRFDAVIGSGVIEHVPNDSESLKELYRVTRPGGHLIVTMLPNRYSYTEWLNRTLKNPHHMRRYTLPEIRRMFLHHGFLPVAWGYHQMVPTLSSVKGGVFDWRLANWLAERLFALNGLLERLPLINRVSTNIFIVGRKVGSFL
ncbi:MAG: class I SAM-dependent methyltransferase [Steroidobacteraceae bacterium]